MTWKININSDMGEGFGRWQLGPDEGGDDTRVRRGPRHVDAADPGVRVRGAQEPRVHHPGEEEIVGEQRLALALRRRDDGEEQ